MRNRILAPSAVLAIVFAAPTAAYAQDVPLSRLLVELIQGDVFLAPPPEGFPSHAAHFVPGTDQAIAPTFFNQQLLVQLGTFPIGSPSGGFSYMFDASTGTFQPMSRRIPRSIAPGRWLGAM